MADEKETKAPERPPLRRWKQMGVELEGGWLKPTRDVAAAVRGAQAKADGSVRVGSGHDGEIITRPHAILEQLLDDIRKLYPDQMNDTCGFHIHTSFTPGDASLLCDREKFYPYFKRRWEKWGAEQKFPRGHEFWTRLRGQNRFCKDLFIPETQLKPMSNRDDRYTMLNFFAWEKHGTIECRMLPMFREVEVALAAVRELSDIFDTYLNETKFAPVRFESDIQLTTDGVALETYEVTYASPTPRKEEREIESPPLVAGDDVFYAIPGAQHLMAPFEPANPITNEP